VTSARGALFIRSRSVNLTIERAIFGILDLNAQYRTFATMMPTTGINKISIAPRERNRREAAAPSLLLISRIAAREERDNGRPGAPTLFRFFTEIEESRSKRFESQ